jgi:hypothetical protein
MLYGSLHILDPRTEETIQLLYENIKKERGLVEAELFLSRVRSILSEQGYDNYDD